VEAFPFHVDREELEEVEVACQEVEAQVEPTCQAVEEVTACQACLAWEWVGHRQRVDEAGQPGRVGSVLRATFQQLIRVSRPSSLS